MYRVRLSTVSTAIAFALLTVLPSIATAQDAKVAPIKLTPEEVAEREGRKACKVKICSAFRAQKAGDEINCDITKSWRKTQLDKIMKKARASWPWGQVVCKANIKLNRDDLIKATTEEKFVLTLTSHTIGCTVKREKAPANIKFSIAPKVQFEKGLAKSAALNWGKIEAPTLVKGAMWTATATDNTFNVLESTLVEDINDFISKRCDEVKAEWQK
ncbi:MAG: hypothetical protein AAGB04_24550 [Pseudomonadota bacterium]